MAICEKIFISLWIMEVGTCKLWRLLMEVVCIVPLIPMVVMMDGSTSHPSWDIIGLRIAYMSIF